MKPLLIGLSIAGAAGLAIALGSKGSGGGGSKSPLGGGNGKEGSNEPPAPKWSAPIEIEQRLTAPGWYSDVLTNREDGDCGNRKGFDVKDVLCDDDGRWDPGPMPFSIALFRHTRAVVVSADVRVVDALGIVARTEYRTTKSSNGRRRGDIDVNEFDLVGPERETGHCERLVRVFSKTSAGKYLERATTDCGIAETPRQDYELYRATREVTLSMDFGEVREYFAKIRPNTPAYAGTKLYGLQLVARDGWVALTGQVAASLSPQRIDITVSYKTRAP